MKKKLLLGAMLCLAAVGASAQDLFEGVATYRTSAADGSQASVYTTYHRGMDQMTDMPQSKTKTLYLHAERTQYSLMGMMGKPIITTRGMDPDTMAVPLFDIADGLEEVLGHRCVRVSYEVDNDMVSEEVTVWLDTSYHIPFHYALDDDIPFGLEVRQSLKMRMKGQSFDIVSELLSVVEGKVDDALFLPPSSEGAVTMRMDADGNPVLEGDTTGLLAPVKSEYLQEVDSAGFRAAIARGRTVCMFTAVWCGPCRLMYPKLEAVARIAGADYRFIKVDIDRCPTIARELGVAAIPVVVLFEDGRELRRITSATHSEEDVRRFVLQD